MQRPVAVILLKQEPSFCSNNFQFLPSLASVFSSASVATSCCCRGKRPYLRAVGNSSAVFQ